jgi:hypothetical protein
MSNSSAKSAVALFVVLVPLAAAFARYASSQAARNVPIPTTGSPGVGKCFQGSPATAAEHVRGGLVHPDSVCWAPQDITDDPGV